MEEVYEEGMDSLVLVRADVIEMGVRNGDAELVLFAFDVGFGFGGGIEDKEFWFGLIVGGMENMDEDEADEFVVIYDGVGIEHDEFIDVDFVVSAGEFESGDAGFEIFERGEDGIKVIDIGVEFAAVGEVYGFGGV